MDIRGCCILYRLHIAGTLVARVLRLVRTSKEEGASAASETAAAAAAPAAAPAAEPEPQTKTEEAAPEPQGCELIFGSFEIQENAEAEMEKAEREGVKCRIVTIPIEKGTVYRVVSEPFASVREAEDKKDYLNSMGFDAYIGE